MKLTKLNNKPIWNARSGMTLLEIILVLALLSIVVTFLARSIFPQFSRGKVQAAKIQIQQLAGDLDRYRIDCNRYPNTSQGLDALLNPPEAPPACDNYDPAGYFSGKQKEIKDVWGGKFQYICEDGINYEIISLGADAKEGGEGENADISSKNL